MIKPLQYLRGVAALLVFCHHWAQLTCNQGTMPAVMQWAYLYGPFGVDLFFALSGFIITNSTLKQVPTAVEFGIKRVVRIFPAYWVFSVGLLIVFQFLPNAFVFTNYTQSSLFLSLLLVPNRNPTGIGAYPFLTVGWTLTFELFFYAIVFVFLKISPKRWIIYSVLALCLLPVFYPLNAPGHFILGSNHLFEFAGGMVIAAVASASKVKQGILGRLTCIGLLAACWFLLRNEVGSWVSISISVVAVCVFAPACSNTKLDSILCFLGNISYSLYLCHIIVIGAVWTLWPFNDERGVSSIAFALSFGLSIALAWLSFRFVENPPIRWVKGYYNSSRVIHPPRSGAESDAPAPISVVS